MFSYNLLLHLLRHIHVAPTCELNDFSRAEIARAQDILELITLYKEDSDGLDKA